MRCDLCEQEIGTDWIEYTITPGSCTLVSDASAPIALSRHIAHRACYVLPHSPRDIGAAVAKIRTGQARHLGSGNFGHAHKVETKRGPLVVKLPTVHNIHGQERTLTEQIAAFEREGAAIAALSPTHPIVPRGMYALHEGIPVIVREYGEIVRFIRPEEFDAIGDALAAVVAQGWRVLDDLLLARRADGSLFVADVGQWCPVGTLSPEWAMDDLGDLLDRVARSQPWAPPSADPTRPKAIRSRAGILHTIACWDRLAESIADLVDLDHTDHAEIERDARKLATWNADRAAVGLSPVTR